MSKPCTMLAVAVLLTTAGIAWGEARAAGSADNSVRTVGNALAIVEANYSRIADLTYDTSVVYMINKQPQGSPAKFHVQQKGGYMTRQTEPDTGLVTIMNAGRTAYLDNKGKFQGGFEVDTVGNLLSGISSTNGAPYYWDPQGFRKDFPGIATNLVHQEGAGLVTFEGVPKDTSMVVRITYKVDCQHGIPVEEVTHTPGGSTLRISHQAPALVGTSIWLPTEESIAMTYQTGLVIEWQTKINNVRINQGLPDSLFAIPKLPNDKARSGGTLPP